MRWFRANSRFGGRLALFALALQLYLSFGHIHADDIYGPVNVSLTRAQAVTLPQAQAVHAIPAGRPWYDSDAFCPICETMYMLGASFVPEAPHLLPPSLSQAAQPIEHVTAILVSPQRSPFQSRAPPRA
jgi:hypothetical protein